MNIYIYINIIETMKCVPKSLLPRCTRLALVIYINKYIYIYIYMNIYIHKYYRDYEMCSKVFAASVHSPCAAFTLSVAPSDLALADTGRL